VTAPTVLWLADVSGPVTVTDAPSSVLVEHSPAVIRVDPLPASTAPLLSALSAASPVVLDALPTTVELMDDPTSTIEIWAAGAQGPAGSGGSGGSSSSYFPSGW